MTVKEPVTVQVNSCPTLFLEDWKQRLEKPGYEYTLVATKTATSSEI